MWRAEGFFAPNPPLEAALVFADVVEHTRRKHELPHGRHREGSGQLGRVLTVLLNGLNLLRILPPVCDRIGWMQFYPLSLPVMAVDEDYCECNIRFYRSRVLRKKENPSSAKGRRLVGL